MSALQEDLVEYEMQLKFSNPSGDISISFTGVIFPDVSVSSPKNKPAMVTTRFRAKTAAVDEQLRRILSWRNNYPSLTS